MADLIARLGANKAPDLLHETAGVPWAYYAMQGPNSLLPVDDMIAELKGEYTESQMKHSYIDGHYRAVPFAVGPVVLFCRKDLFQKAGLKLPQTWDELLTAAQTLTQDTNKDGTIDIYGYSPNGGRQWMTQYEFHSYMMSNGAYATEEKGRVVFNSPKTVEALKFFIKLFDPKTAPPGASNHKYSDTQTNFIMGKAAMVFSFGYLPRRVSEQNPDIVPYVTAVPVPRHTLQIPRRSGGDTNSFFISAATKNPNEVKRLLRFILTKESTLEINQAYPGGNLPAQTSVRESKEYMENPVLKKFPEATKVLIDETKYSHFVGGEFVQNPGTGQMELKLPLPECVQRVLIDGWTPERAVEETHNKLVEMLGQK
jgi:multiple sugar transport system substrate-binding protein